MTRLGKLIVFEGPDGAGKSTLAHALQQLLSSTKTKWSLLAFPGNEEGSLGKHVYTLHHNMDQFAISKINPESLQILHVAAHVDWIENRIKPALKQGENIIMDRFWWSTWVYGMSSGVDQQALEKLIDLEIYHWQDILPQIVFFIDCPVPFRKEMGDEKWSQIRSLYHVLSKRESNRYCVIHIENNNPLEEVIHKVFCVVKKNYKTLTSLQPETDRGYQTQVSPNNYTPFEQIPLPFKSSHGHANPSIIHPSIFPVIPTKVYDTYWRFAAERQEIFYKKLEGNPPPWTKDPILSHYKFTNAYRASDRVSQYLIRNVIYHGSQQRDELFFRILLFKVFNRISTWEILLKQLGEISLTAYSFEQYDQVLTKAMKNGTPIFSAAYIMPSGGKNFSYPLKHQVFLRLIEKMIIDRVPDLLADVPSMRSAFEILRSYPLMGDFLAYQYAVDINYSTLTNFSESEFVIPGPGAKNGLKKCFADFGGLSEIDLIRLITDIQEDEFARLGINFKSLWGRRLQLIDCQNLFCEVDKYARVAHPDIGGVNSRNRIKQIYKQESGAIEYWYPPKWGINESITKINAGSS